MWLAPRPATGPLPADVVSAASAARLCAALRSRSRTRPQVVQVKMRSRSGSLAFTTPQCEQVLLDGYQRSATNSRPPFHPALYASWILLVNWECCGGSCSGVVAWYVLRLSVWWSLWRWVLRCRCSRCRGLSLIRRSLRRFMPCMSGVRLRCRLWCGIGWGNCSPMGSSAWRSGCEAGLAGLLVGWR